MAYFVGERNGQAAIRLWIDDAGRVSFRKLWEIRRAGSSSHQVTSHGLVADGLLYLARSTDESGGHHPIAWDQMDVYETARGQHLARPNPVIMDTSSPLPVVRAGEYVVISDKGHRGRSSIPPKAVIAFLAMGDRPYVVTREDLGDYKLQASPTFSGPFMFLRVPGKVISIGSSDEAQQLRDLQSVAAFASAEVGYEPRLAGTRVQPISSDDLKGVPVNPLQSAMMPTNWLMFGPFPTAKVPEEDGAAALSRQLIKNGAEVTIGGAKREGKPLPSNALLSKGMARVYLSDGEFYKVSSQIDLSEATDKQAYSTTYLYTVLQVPRSMDVVFRGRGTETWLAGTKLEENDEVNLEPGVYPMMVKTQVERFPPVGYVSVQPRFLETVSSEKQREAWLDRIRIRSSLFKRAQSTFGEQGMGLRASQLLEALKTGTLDDDDRAAGKP
jgi:hypothetical protein